MSENPFDQSSLNPANTVASPVGNQSYAMAGPGVMLKAPAMLRVFLPIALIASSLIGVAAIMFAVKDFPLNLIVSIAMFSCEVPVAAGFWFYYNSAFICADDNGVTKSQWGKATTIPWVQIASIEWLDVGKGNLRYILKNSSGDMVLDFVDFGDSVNGGKLRDFIVAKVGKGAA